MANNTVDTQNSLSNQIYLSRDNIRNQIISLAQTYLDLNDVDLTQTSFLSFIINTLSTLTSNLFFYQSSVFREFFLTQAQLPTSVLNLSSFIGYTPSIATFSTCEILVTMPLTFDSDYITIDIPTGFNFYAGSVIFQTYFDSQIVITNNSNVSIVSTQSIIGSNDNRIFNLPSYVDSTAELLSFMLQVNQYQTLNQEFQVDSDIQIYQFIEQDVTFTGEISGITVTITPPNSNSPVTYTQFNSLYLMSNTDTGYVIKRTTTGITLQFGNGLIGYQPPPSSSINVTLLITLGSAGNVIAGSITSGDRLYCNSSNGTELVTYTVTNTSSATGGTDEESIDQTKNNAIANLSTMNRLVSQVDYSFADVVLGTAPISNPYPVLKRSDINVNEIQLYSVLNYNNDIVPTRNLTYKLPLSQVAPISKNLIITDTDGTQYITLFDMNIDLINNSTNFNYTINQIATNLTLLYSWSNYNVIANQLIVSDTTSNITFALTYQTTQSDFNNTYCQMTIQQTGSAIYEMINDYVNQQYLCTIPYLSLPAGNLDLNFTIAYDDSTSNLSFTISQYSTNVIVRQDLSPFMLSNTFSDGTNVIIYDIPTIDYNYYLNLTSKQDFELNVLQSMLSSFNLVNYRMMTDFTNVKFTNTTGTMLNMQLNASTQPDVKDIYLTAVPTLTFLGDRYIVSGAESGVWANQYGNIAQYVGVTGQYPTGWAFITPSTDDIVYVTNKNTKFIYSEGFWVIPNYQIPLQIYLEIFKDPTYSGSNDDLLNTIQTTLVTAFSSRFGSNIEMYRSEIESVVQSIIGVNHCRLIKPSSSIFFNFNIDNFTQSQLLTYTPEYIYFKASSISANILK